jgi:hypothetical protein
VSCSFTLPGCLLLLLLPSLPCCLRRVEEGLPLLRNVMGNHVKEEGRALVNDPEKVSAPAAFADVKQGLVGRPAVCCGSWDCKRTAHICMPSYM